MIKIDSSNLINANCWIINNQNQISSYQSNSRTRYYLFGNKWFKSDQSTYSSIPNDYQCYTTEQIKDLPSPYDYIEPIYQIIAIVSVITIIFLAYKLIIYPFFRSKL